MWRWLILCWLCAVAGCGGGDDAERSSPGGGSARAQITSTIDSLGTAGRRAEGARICNELFTENLAISVARSSERSCEKEVIDGVFSSKSRFTVNKVVVDGDRASARVTDERGRRSDLQLRREGGSWRISRIS